MIYNYNRIFCVGRNYFSHIKEMNNEIPKKPIIFLKQKNSISLSNKIYYPDNTKEFSYESELVLKMGDIKDKLINSVESFTLGLDLTLRDIQRDSIERGLPWEKSKAFDCSAPLGNFYNIKTSKDLNGLTFTLKINNVIKQIGKVENMIFSFEEILSEISIYWKLEKGDLIFTGTPEGIGTLKKGDILDLFSNKTKKITWQVI